MAHCEKSSKTIYLLFNFISVIDLRLGKLFEKLSRSQERTGQGSPLCETLDCIKFITNMALGTPIKTVYTASQSLGEDVLQLFGDPAYT